MSHAVFLAKSEALSMSTTQSLEIKVTNLAKAESKIGEE
jgi:hypothetical protein